MKRLFSNSIPIMLAILLSFTTSGGALAASPNWTLKGEFPLEQPALAMAGAPDGKTVYLLVPGKLLVYSVPARRVTDFMPVDRELDKLFYSPADNLFLLSSSRNNMVKLYQLERRARIELSGAPVRGKEGAPVTIAVYSDFQCPYCGKLEPLLKQVEEKYPDQVKVVAKQYPLSFHKFARGAAAAALAAGEQGKYWEFHDRLFEGAALPGEEKILQIAASLKLDLESFNKRRSDPAIQRQIERDLAEGRENGVNGTPAVFVNGKQLFDRSLEGFGKMILSEVGGS